jgi:hypothetical protein
MTIVIIVGVLVVSALIGVAAWRFIKSVESLHANPAKLRRRLIVMAAMYCFGMIMAIANVLQGKAPAIALVGLPFGLYFAWSYLRAAARLKKASK